MIQRPIHTLLNATVDRPRDEILAFLEATNLTLDAGSGSTVRLRAAMVGDWWFLAIDGSGPIQINRGGNAPTRDFALINLTRSGRYRSYGYVPILNAPNTLSLSRLSQVNASLRTVTNWGHFEILSFFVPHALLSARHGQAAIPYGTMVSAETGAGAILAGCLRALADQVHNTTRDISAVLPEIIPLISSAFLHGDRPGEPLEKGKRERILDFMFEHVSEPSLSPKLVAEACGVSERQLYRLFARHNERFRDVLGQLRLERACRRLIETPAASITEIAYGSGYASLSHFGQAFKRHHGVSPREFRKRYAASFHPGPATAATASWQQE